MWCFRCQHRLFQMPTQVVLDANTGCSTYIVHVEVSTGCSTGCLQRPPHVPLGRCMQRPVIGFFATEEIKIRHIGTTAAVVVFFQLNCQSSCVQKSLLFKGLHQHHQQQQKQRQQLLALSFSRANCRNQVYRIALTLCFTFRVTQKMKTIHFHN